jgi:hypothetical protein
MCRNEILVKIPWTAPTKRKKIWPAFGSREFERKFSRSFQTSNRFKLPRGVSVAEALDEYQKNPQILYAEPNYILHLTAAPGITLTPNDPSYGSLGG